MGGGGGGGASFARFNWRGSLAAHATLITVNLDYLLRVVPHFPSGIVE